MSVKSISRQDILAGLFLFIALFGLYGLSYSGVPAADDEQLFAAAAINAAENRVLSAEQLYGNTRLVGDYGGVEPLHSLVASWVLRGGVFDHVGRMQALFWLNICYTALTALVLYGLLLQLGGSRKHAVIAGMAFGVGTLVWPYAKTFFREPLAMLLLTLAVYFLVLATKWRRRLWVRIVAGIGALVCASGALLTKVLLVAVLPAMIVLIWLRHKKTNGILKKEKWLQLAVTLIAFLLLLRLGGIILGVHFPPRLTLEFFLERYRNLMVLPHDGFWQALAGIFFSPGKGIFIYSPILLGSILSGFAVRRENAELFWFPLLGVAGLAVVQALVYDAEWWNLTWGTRFLLPVLPLLVLMGLPGLQWLEKNGNLRWRMAAWVLLFLSCFIQLGGVLITEPMYLASLYAASIRPIPELVLWNLRYAPWIGHWQQIFQGASLDLAAARIFSRGGGHILILWAGQIALVMGSLLAVLRMWRKKRQRRLWTFACFLGISTLVVTGFSMSVNRQDPAYHPDREDFAAAERLVESSLAKGDGVIVSPYLYPLWYHAMNEAQFDQPWYSWPVPGDAEESSEALDRFMPDASRYQRMWLIEERSAAGDPYPAAGQLAGRFNLVEQWVYFDETGEKSVQVSLFEVR